MYRQTKRQPERLSEGAAHMLMYQQRASTIPLQPDDMRGNVPQWRIFEALNDTRNLPTDVRLMIDTYCRTLVYGFNERVAFVATFCEGADWYDDCVGSRILHCVPRLRSSQYVQRRIRTIEAATPISSLWNPQRALDFFLAFAHEMTLKGKAGLAKEAMEEAGRVREHIKANAH
ncbi:protein of unknown function [Burkholderia multivorans]